MPMMMSMVQTSLGTGWKQALWYHSWATESMNLHNKTGVRRPDLETKMTIQVGENSRAAFSVG